MFWLTVQKNQARLRSCALVPLLVLGLINLSAAEEPFRRRIDQTLQNALFGPDAGFCSDAEFLRRVSLDLHGAIPTAEEARVFLDDPSPDKQVKLVDRLLADPRFNRHWANVLDVTLMERRRSTHVKAAEWEKYLLDSVVANKPYNQLAREILAADGSDEKNRAAAKFYLDREGEPHLITRDVGRIFFGQDLQCAQCHNHPLIDDYLQDDYFGLFAFFSRGSLFTDTKAKKSFFAESAEGDAVFTSVFTDITGRTRPRLPSQLEIDEPVIPASQQYKVKPGKNKRAIPTYSRREELAKRATDGSNNAFNRNIANRLWAHMMGRGLVQPLDLHHPENPPSNPELMDLLADGIAEMQFDMRAFLRELALTDVYRRGFDMPADLQEVSTLPETVETLKAEKEKQGAIADALYTEFEELGQTVEQAQDTYFETEKEAAAASTSYAAAKKTSDAAAAASKKSQGQLAKLEQQAAALKEALEKAEQVVKEFPDDKELTTAAESYRKRTAQTAEQIAAINKTIEQQRVAAKVAAEKAVEPKRLAEEAQQKFQAAQQALAEARAPYLQKLYAYRAAREEEMNLLERIKQTENLIAYAETSKQLQETVATLKLTRSELTDLQTAKSQTDADVTLASEQLAEPQRLHELAAARVKSLRGPYNAQAKLAKQVSDAAVASRKALEALPQDADLKASAEQLEKLAEQLQQELAPLTAELQAAEQTAAAAAEKFKTAQAALDQALAQQQQAQQAIEAADQKLQQVTAAEQSLRTKAESSYQDLAGEFEGRFATGALQALSPEQLCWSMLQATGQVTRQETVARQEWIKKQKDDKKEETPITLEQLEAAVYAKLKGNESVFVKTFGAGAGQPQDEFFATVDQSLFFANGGQVRGWLQPSGGNLTDRVLKMDDPAAGAEELYLAILTRRPTEQETNEIRDYLAGFEKEQKSAAVQEIAWALLTSAEFRFQH